MNSIKPTISVDANKAAVAAFAIAALAIMVLGVTETMAAAARSKSGSLLQAAEAMPRGTERDGLLAAAHVAAVDAIGLAPRDGALSAQAARILYLQATTAAVEEVSIPLLDASRDAALEARKDSPDDAGAAALLALVEMARLEAPSANAVSEVVRSYAGRAHSSEVALWRGEAAAHAWTQLAGPQRIAAATEVCALQRAPTHQSRARAVAARIDLAMGYVIDPAAPARVCGLSSAEVAASLPPPEERAPAPVKKPEEKKRGRKDRRG